MTTIYLMRHGKTYWNGKGNDKHQTHSNGIGNRVTKEGLEIVEGLGIILKHERFDIVFGSRTYRGIESLHAATKHFVHKFDYVIDPRINERSMSFLDGMGSEEWIIRFPITAEIINAYRADPYNYTFEMDNRYEPCMQKAMEIAKENGERRKVIPHWENYPDLSKRIWPFIEEACTYETVLIMGHRGSNKSMLVKLLQGSSYLRNDEDIMKVDIPNGAIYRVKIDKAEVKLHHNSGNGWKDGFVR